jgi:hypothetical protein
MLLPMIARSALVLLLAGCTCDAPAPPSATPAPLPSEVEPEVADVVEASPERAEPEPPAAEDARAWLSRLRDARRLHHDGEHAAALAAFRTLLEDRPGSTRLRCEAGLVAYRSGDLDEAERLTTVALRTWRQPVSGAERIPFAMCLYNRGLVARDRSDPDVAADVWRRSLELRPNHTVAAALAELNEPEEDDENLSDLASNLAAMQEQYGVEPTLTRTGAGTLTVVEASFGPYAEEEDGAECRSIEVLLESPDGVVALPVGVTECLWFSYFDDHSSIDEAQVFDGGASLGRVVVVGTGAYGRADAPDGGSIEWYAESTLHLCAERLDWACAEVPLQSRAGVDCMGSGGCDDPEDQSDDADALPVESTRGYALNWSIQGDVLVLEPSPESDATTAPPRVGRVPLAELFE